MLDIRVNEEAAQKPPQDLERFFERLKRVGYYRKPQAANARSTLSFFLEASRQQDISTIGQLHLQLKTIAKTEGERRCFSDGTLAAYKSRMRELLKAYFEAHDAADKDLLANVKQSLAKRKPQSDRDAATLILPIDKRCVELKYPHDLDPEESLLVSGWLAGIAARLRSEIKT